VSFAQWFAAAGDASRPVAILDAASERSLASLGANEAPRVILIGPEGGFDAVEVRLAHAAGAAPVHLGARVLRAETAALAALATSTRSPATRRGLSFAGCRR
jgi:16S rRNA (uracil1498-N3)-methyltransferase